MIAHVDLRHGDNLVDEPFQLDLSILVSDWCLTYLTDLVFGKRRRTFDLVRLPSFGLHYVLDELVCVFEDVKLVFERRQSVLPQRPVQPILAANDGWFLALHP